MRDAAKIFDKDGVEAKYGVLVALSFHHIAYRQRPHVAAVFEIPGIESMISDFVKNLAAFGPFRKRRRGYGGHGACDVLVFVVFLGTPDDGVLHCFFDHLSDFGLRQRDINDQALAILKSVLVAALGRDGRSRKQEEQEKSRA